jgi:hypothetical protein
MWMDIYVFCLCGVWKKLKTPNFSVTICWRCSMGTRQRLSAKIPSAWDQEIFILAFLVTSYRKDRRHLALETTLSTPQRTAAGSYWKICMSAAKNPESIRVQTANQHAHVLTFKCGKFCKNSTGRAHCFAMWTHTCARCTSIY